MKAIIIAAGSGQRLDSETTKLPKGLLDINGKNILERQINLLKNKNIQDIIIITGPYKEKFNFSNVNYVEDLEYEKHDVLLSLMIAKNEIQGDILIIYSDILFDEQVLQQVLESKADIGITIDLDWEKKYENRTEHPKSEADNVIIQNNKILKIRKNITEISHDQVNGEFIGIVKLSTKGSEIFLDMYNQVEKTKPTSFHDAASFEKSYLTDMLQELIDQGISLDPIIIDGNWCEIDTPQDLKTAKKLFV